MNLYTKRYVFRPKTNFQKNIILNNIYDLLPLHILIKCDIQLLYIKRHFFIYKIVFYFIHDIHAGFELNIFEKMF